MKLKFGIPIGNLQEATLEMMRRAGFNVTVRSRSYYPEIDDPEIEARLLRPQDMSRFVEKGVVDCGLTGNDWVAENGSRVHVVTELTYSKQSLTPFRWVIAVPENSPIKSVKDLQGKRISTELVNVCTEFLRKSGVSAGVEFSHGATESKAPDLVDAIMDGTETGSSLRANKMRIVENVLTSRPQLIASDGAWADSWKREKMESMAILFEGALAARFKVGLKMNVSKDKLQAVLKTLPAMKNPTVSGLMGPDMMSRDDFALETIVDESVVRKIIPDLRRAGATAIVEYPLNKVIP